MLGNYINNIAKNSAGLAIKTSSSALAKTTNEVVYTYNGKVYVKAAADLTALTGISIADGYQKVLTVYVNTAGTVSYGVSDAIANTATIDWAKDVKRDELNVKSLLGYIWISNATGSAFTGGTTALDTASLTVRYINATSIDGI